MQGKPQRKHGSARAMLYVACVGLCLSACLLLAACAGGGSMDSGTTEVSGASFSLPDSVIEPQSSAGGGTAIDGDYASDGYVTASGVSDARLKFQVRCGGETYNYDLANDGSIGVFPVNMGNGSYTFRIMQNTSGNNYVELDSYSTYVSLSDETAPFLVGNVFCSYTGSSSCVQKARSLVQGADNVGLVVKSICEFVAGSVSYDNAKAEQLVNSSGYVPNPDQTLSSGKGICFDFASLSAAMLRSVGIPAKVMTGWVGEDELYHSWIKVYIDGTWHSAFFDVNPGEWSLCDVTFASAGSSQYVGDGSSYIDRYTY